MYNTLMDKKTLQEFILPTPAQAFWCIALAVISTLVVYHQALLERLAHGQAVPLDLVNHTFSEQLALLNQYQFVQTGVIVLFWALVGLCTFAIYAALRNSGSTVMDELTIRTQYTNRSRGGRKYSWVLIRIAAAVGFLLMLQLVWRAGLPFWFGLIEQFMLGTISAASTVSLFAGIFGLSFTFYALWVLLHTAIIADRL